jgi:hypothetical protein
MGRSQVLAPKAKTAKTLKAFTGKVLRLQRSWRKSNLCRAWTFKSTNNFKRKLRFLNEKFGGLTFCLEVTKTARLICVSCLLSMFFLIVKTHF